MIAKRLLIDLDGVFADWTKGLAILFGKDPESLRDADEVGELAQALGLKSKSAIWARIDRAGQEWWANLPPYPDAMDAWKRLKGTGVEMGILATSGETRGSVEGKREWIRRHTGSQTRWAIATTKSWCANPFTMLVDDRARVLDPFVEAGGQGILMPRKPGPERLAAWEEVIEWAQPRAPFGLSKADFARALVVLSRSGLTPQVEWGRVIVYTSKGDVIEASEFVSGSETREALEILNDVFGTLSE